MSEKPGPSCQASDTPGKSFIFKLRKEVDAVRAEDMFDFDYIFRETYKLQM